MCVSFQFLLGRIFEDLRLESYQCKACFPLGFFSEWLNAPFFDKFSVTAFENIHRKVTPRDFFSFLELTKR